MKTFPSPARFVRKLVYGSEPVGKRGAQVLEAYSPHSLDGGRMGGLPHFGMKGDESLTFLGYVASPQLFYGAAQLFGASTNLSVDNQPALPSGHTPPALPTWAQEWAELEGIVPSQPGLS